MKSTKLKTVLLGLSCFAFASAFAQDSPKTPNPDTTKAPKHDSTSMRSTTMHSNLVRCDLNVLNAYFTTNGDVVALKNEAENEILTKRSLAGISS